jgi:hypothetical protein
VAPYQASMSFFANWRSCPGVRKSASWAGREIIRLWTTAANSKLFSVVNYEVSTGSLLLEYGFPQGVLPTPQASIDVRLVLESINAHDLQRGSWVNIIGYVRRPEQRQKRTISSNANNTQKPEIPIVQAIIVWGAGAIKVADYETALVNQREMKQAVDIQAPTKGRITEAPPR